MWFPQGTRARMPKRWPKFAVWWVRAAGSVLPLALRAHGVLISSLPSLAGGRAQEIEKIERHRHRPFPPHRSPGQQRLPGHMKIKHTSSRGSVYKVTGARGRAQCPESATKRAERLLVEDLLAPRPGKRPIPQRLHRPRQYPCEENACKRKQSSHTSVPLTERHSAPTGLIPAKGRPANASSHHTRRCRWQNATMRRQASSSTPSGAQNTRRK